MDFLVSIMDFFISSANADAGAAPSQGGGNMFMMVALVLFVGVFYFLTIRPQQKKEKETVAMLDTLTPDDEVMTNGGFLAKVVNVGESFVTIEIATGVQINVQKRAIVALMPKGSIESVNAPTPKGSAESDKNTKSKDSMKSIKKDPS